MSGMSLKRDITYLSDFDEKKPNFTSLDCVRIYALKRKGAGGGVNCLRGIFANFEGIMKINVELQRK